VGDTRKITARLPTRLLASTQAYAGKGVTEPLRTALEQFVHAERSRRMLELQGEIQIDIDLEEFRKDRGFDENGDVIS
jgi:hypothetical protein